MMNLKNASLTALALFGLATLAPARQAHAVTTHFHASYCNQDPTVGGGGSIGYSMNGSFNNTAHPSTVTVQCGGTLDVSKSVTNVQVRVFDRNPSASVLCQVTVFDQFHNLLANNAASTGVATNSPSVIALGIAVPASGASEFTVRCDIPGTTASGISFVTSYEVNY